MTSPQGPSNNTVKGPNEPSRNAGGGGLPPNLPDPVIEPRSRWMPSLVWVIPLIAALIGIALVVKSVSGRGPTITISFVSAEGLETGKTKVKYKDVDVGTVKEHHAVEGPLARAGRRPVDQGSRGLRGEGHALLGGAPARGGKRRDRARHVAVRRVYRRGCREVQRGRNPFRRARNPARRDRRPERAAVHVARRVAGFHRYRLADLLPARAGRAGRRLFARQGRHRRHHAGVRERAVRSVRRARIRAGGTQAASTCGSIRAASS